MSSVSVCAETRSASTVFFFFNDTATTEIYTLSLHDALPIYRDQLDHVVPLRDDLPPARTLRVPRVDRNHPLARCVQVGHEVEHGPVVPDEAVARVEVVQQPHDVPRHARPPRIPQVEIVDPVPP